MPILRFNQTTITLCEGETVLSALLREGHSIPYSCRSGVCQTCMMKLMSGSVPPEATAGIGDSQREQGFFLPCVCQPKGDIEIQHVGEGFLVNAVVMDVHLLAPTVVRVRLNPISNFSFRGGQFVSLIRADGLCRSYSVASLPSDGYLELHVRILPDGQMSRWIAQDLCIGDVVQLKGPFGDCFYSQFERTRPLLLACTGTGLAPILGVLRSAIASQHTGPIVLLQGARNVQGLYYQEQLTEIAADHSNVTLMYCCKEGPIDSTTGVIGSLDDLVLEQYRKIPEARAYLCGNAAFVQKTQFDLFLAGLSSSEIFADAFIPSKP